MIRNLVPSRLQNFLRSSRSMRTPETFKNDTIRSFFIYPNKRPFSIAFEKLSQAISAGSWNKKGTVKGLSATNSYEFRFTLTDSLGYSDSQTINVSTARVVLDIHKNEGVGIGKLHERGVLDVDGTVYMNGKIMALGGLGFEDTRTINDQPQEIPVVFRRLKRRASALLFLNSF